MFGNRANICTRCVGNFMKLIKLIDMAVFEKLVEEARAFEAPKPPEVN